MGVELILGAASLAVGVIGAASAANDRTKAANAQKKANDVSIAEQQNQSIEDRRQRIREYRVRSAGLIQQSEDTGTAGSSGESGGISALGSNFGTLLDMQKSATLANTGINKDQQQAADYENNARTTEAFTNVFTEGLKTFGTIFEDAAKNQ